MKQFAATVLTTQQIGIETWKDIRTTKVFTGDKTFDDVLEWAKTIDKSATISTIELSDIVE